MNAPAFFQALTQAIFSSLFQALIIYGLTRLTLSAFKNLSPSLRYNILYTSLGLICAAFLINFFSYYDSVNETGKQPIPGLLKKLPAAEAIRPYSLWISGIYFAGLLFQTISLLIGLYRLKIEILKDSIPASIFWSKRLEELKLELKMLRKISFHFSENILVPFTAGFIRPVILFPLATVNQLSIVQIEAVLLHELAHIKRNDYLMNIVQRVMEIILFFNPIIWVLARDIKAEREYCCDEMVVETMTDPVTYARALALIEEHRVTINDLAIPANGNRKNVLLTRIKNITNMKTQNANPKHGLLSLSGVVAITLSIAWIIPSHTAKVDTVPKLKIPASSQLMIPAAPALPADIDAHSVPTPPARLLPEIKIPPAPPAPPAPADTTDRKRYFNSAEWKTREEALKKSAKEMDKYFNSPEWKNKIVSIEKSGDELEKKFNTPEWKSKIKAIENLGEELDKKINSPEWKAHLKKFADHSAGLEEKFNSKEWKERIKNLEDQRKEIQKKFNSPEWKSQMKQLRDHREQLDQRLNSPQWKKNMEDQKIKNEYFNSDTLRMK